MARALLNLFAGNAGFVIRDRFSGEEVDSGSWPTFDVIVDVTGILRWVEKIRPGVRDSSGVATVRIRWRREFQPVSRGECTREEVAEAKKKAEDYLLSVAANLQERGVVVILGFENDPQVPCSWYRNRLVEWIQPPPTWCRRRLESKIALSDILPLDVS